MRGQKLTNNDGSVCVGADVGVYLELNRAERAYPHRGTSDGNKTVVPMIFARS